MSMELRAVWDCIIGRSEIRNEGLLLGRATVELRVDESQSDIKL